MVKLTQNIDLVHKSCLFIRPHPGALDNLGSPHLPVEFTLHFIYLSVAALPELIEKGIVPVDVLVLAFDEVLLRDLDGLEQILLREYVS
jgi:hypothetical protein